MAQRCINVVVCMAMALWWFMPQNAHAQLTVVNSRETFEAALAGVTPGSTIMIANGTYTDWGTFTLTELHDGTSDQWVTITGESEGGVIFSGSSSLSLIVRSQYLVISNLVFQSNGKFDAFGAGATGLDGLLIFDGAQDVSVQNLSFLALHGDGVVVPIMEYRGNRETRRITFDSILVDGADLGPYSAFSYVYGGLNRGTPRDIVWKNSTFKNRTCTMTVPYCYWLKFGDGAASVGYDSGLVIDGNIFQDDQLIADGQNALFIEGMGVILTDNHFENVGTVNFRAGDGHVIARNTFVDPLTHRQGAAINIQGGDHEVVSNACMNTSHARVCLSLGKGTVDSGDGGAGPDYEAFHDSLVAHNAFSMFRDAAITMADNHVGHYDGQTSVFPSGIEFHNNAVLQATGTMFIGDDCTSEFASISHNARSGTATAGCMSEGTNNVTTPPDWHVNSVKPFYSSPLVGAGVALPSYPVVATDLLGLRRDSSPDIGAIEWGGQEPPDETETASDVCNRIYGETQDYVLCEATASECTFSVVLAGSSCNELCAGQGKACVGAFESSGVSCVDAVGSSDDCDTERDADEICVCESEDPAEAPAPRSVTIRYVDSSCETQGNGTTTTCGATGPWNSLEYALNTVKCVGMLPDDVLLVKGNVSAPSSGNWYDDIYHQPAAVSADPLCSGILIQNMEDEHVVIDGTVDIVESTWVHVGDDVYECQGANCGTRDSFPFTAWVSIAGTEHQLDLVQSQHFCDVSLAAGEMIYNPAGHRVCLHLPDDSDPSDADYVRIPYHASAFDLSQQAVSGITFRSNPGGGSLTLTRYRDRLINMNPSVNSDITVDGLELSWTMDRAISVGGGDAGSGGFYFVNNEIHHIGQDGIAWLKDSEFSIISNNEIHDIGMVPIFEQCEGVGQGCMSSFINPPNAIRVNNCTADNLSARSIISNNEIYNVGSGLRGISYGIHLQHCTFFNRVESNLIYDSTASGLGFRAVMISGIPEGQYHDKNIITNTRCENADICLATSFEAWEKVEELEQFADQRGRRNYFLGNTCYNPLMHCWLQEDGGETEGELILRNNLAVTDADHVVLLNAVAPTFWAHEFRHNGFECSHADCVDEVIVDFNGVQYKRDGECTAGTDCISDINPASGNLYGVFSIQTGTLELSAGSEAINAGEDMEAIPVDFAGTRRPLGLSADIGAHEYTVFDTTIALTQGGYRFYERFVANGDSPISAENGEVNIHARSEFTLRIGIYGSPDSHKGKVSLMLYAQHCDPSCGSYEPITFNCDDNAVCMVNNPNYRDAYPLDSMLSIGGRDYLSTSGYADGEESAERVGHLIGANEQVELEFSLAVGAVDVGDVVKFRVYNMDGTALSDYIATPTMTIATPFDQININRQ